MESLQVSPIYYVVQLPESDELKIKLQKYFKNSKASLLEKYFETLSDHTECSICLNEYSTHDYAKNALFVTKCGHIYHKSCIQTYDKPACPMCRETDVIQQLTEWNLLQKKVHIVFHDRIQLLGLSHNECVDKLQFLDNFRNVSLEGESFFPNDTVPSRLKEEKTKHIAPNYRGPLLKILHLVAYATELNFINALQIE